MARQNRVTPTGEIVGISLRGGWMGNRGCLHRDGEIVRASQVKRWIICRTEYKGERVPQWEPGLYTPLFFHDEAVALAAGHRPCGECRLDRFNSFFDLWAERTGERPLADALDAELHAARVAEDGAGQRTHKRSWGDLPDGAFVRYDGGPALIAGRSVVPWSPDGYGQHLPRPEAGEAEVLTPAPTVDVLSRGYRPHIADEALAGGHVFVVAGDLLDLRCDAWMLPTDAHLGLSSDFATVVSLDARTRARAAGFGASRVMRLPEDDPGAPTVWLANIGTTTPNARWYAEGVEAFAREAADDLEDLRRSSQRRPVLALPVVGTGAGGAHEVKAEVLRELLPTLEACAAKYHVDLVLVTRSRQSYAAAQWMRRKAQRGDRSQAGRRHAWALGPDNDVTDRLHAAADELARSARAGNLTLFVGAGASQSSGIPDWNRLLQNLAARLDAGDLAERLPQLDARDQASVLQRRYRRDKDDENALKEAVAEELEGGRPSLVHQLLASLPVQEMVTTNFDDLLERAVAAVRGSTPAILPYEAAKAGEGWVLKLHGTVGRPESLVFTRDDYMRTPITHGALLGLVQALLVTRNMLFVGYSLRDEDFHQLVHEISTAIAGATRLGSALLLEADELREDLWADNLDLVVMDGSLHASQQSELTVGIRARRVQILLDLVGCLAADVTHFVLDDTYTGLLDDAEPLRERLRALVSVLKSTDDDLVGPLRETLVRYGMPGG